MYGSYAQNIRVALIIISTEFGGADSFPSQETIQANGYTDVFQIPNERDLVGAGDRL